MAVVGGGPVGSALSLYLARAGVRVLLVDAGASERKVCGEGILPAGWRVLEELGIALKIRERAAIRGLRYSLPSDLGFQSMRAALRGEAYGVTRAHLYRVFREAVRESPVELLEGYRLREFRLFADGVELVLQDPERAQRTVRCSHLFAADGLHSQIRRKAGLAGHRPPRYRRWGARCYFHSREVRDEVEVTLGDGVESYLTPLGEGRYGLAFLWSPKLLPESAFRGERIVERLLDRFPPDFLARLPALEGDFWEGTRAVGPLHQRVLSPLHKSGRIALAGDAAGYLDALTGEGLCLGLRQARALSYCFCTGRLSDYPCEHRRIKARHRLVVRGLLWLIHHPLLRHRVFHALSRTPEQFQAVVRFAVEEASIWSLPTRQSVEFLCSLLRVPSVRAGSPN